MCGPLVLPPSIKECPHGTPFDDTSQINAKPPLGSKRQARTLTKWVLKPGAEPRGARPFLVRIPTYFRLHGWNEQSQKGKAIGRMQLWSKSKSKNWTGREAARPVHCLSFGLQWNGNKRNERAYVTSAKI